MRITFVVAYIYSKLLTLCHYFHNKTSLKSLALRSRRSRLFFNLFCWRAVLLFCFRFLKLRDEADRRLGADPLGLSEGVVGGYRELEMGPPPKNV